MRSYKSSSSSLLTIFLKGRSVTTSAVRSRSAFEVTFHRFFAAFAVFPFFFLSSNQSVEPCLAVPSEIESWRILFGYSFSQSDVLDV